MQSIKWDWYGTWLIDYFCARDIDEAYDAWESAYLIANPELLEARENLTTNDRYDAPGTTLNLVENHYREAMEPVFTSWIWAVYLALHWPANTIRKFIWTAKRRFS